MSVVNIVREDNGDIRLYGRVESLDGKIGDFSDTVHPGDPGYDKVDELAPGAYDIHEVFNRLRDD